MEGFRRRFRVNDNLERLNADASCQRGLVMGEVFERDA